MPPRAVTVLLLVALVVAVWAHAATNDNPSPASVPLVPGEQPLGGHIEAIISEHVARALASGAVLADESPDAKHHVPAHTCAHDKKYHQDTIQSVVAAAAVPTRGSREEMRLHARAASWQSFNMAFDTSRIANAASLDSTHACIAVGDRYVDVESDTTRTCESADVLTAPISSLLRNSVIPAVIDIIESLIRIEPPQSGDDDLVADGGCEARYDITFPSSLPTGQNFFIVATARPVWGDGSPQDCSEGCVLAYALACALAQSNGRPTFGHVNFNPAGYSDSTSATALRKLIRVALHEVTHALGFSSFFLQNDFYFDSAKGPESTWAASLTSRLGANGISRTFVITPRVAQVAQCHYNCPSSIGIEVEDTGGSGTAGSHWEQRVANGELMCGFVSGRLAVSDHTLALLEDSGWYQADYSKQERLWWGYQQGCAWAEQTCSEATWPGYWCADDLFSTRGCSAGGQYLTTCNLIEYDSGLDRNFRYFTDPRLGGASSTADYCPFYDPGYGFDCTDVSANASRFNNSIFGPSSLCYTLGYDRKLAACLVSSCSADGQTLSITYGGVTKACPSAGGPLSFDGLAQSVNCPAATTYCVSPNPNPECQTIVVRPSLIPQTAAAPALVSPVVLLAFGLLAVLALIY